MLLTCEMYSELNYLLVAGGKWKAKFLDAIKNSIADRQDVKNMILYVMQITAGADDGISQSEEAMINELKVTMGL